MLDVKDLIGKRFGRWLVVSYSHKTPRYYTNPKTGEKRIKAYRHFYDCVCECGKRKTVNADNLLSGLSTSCGCKTKEATIQRNLRGGYCLKNKRIYTMYKDIIRRCYNKSCNAYRWYGAKGIKVCDEWLQDIGKFFDFCYNYGYKDDLTIDRIDSDGDYCPENCRFINVGFNALRGVFKREYGREGTDEEVMEAYGWNCLR